MNADVVAWLCEGRTPDMEHWEQEDVVLFVQQARDFISEGERIVKQVPGYECQVTALVRAPAEVSVRALAEGDDDA